MLALPAHACSAGTIREGRLKTRAPGVSGELRECGWPRAFSRQTLSRGRRIVNGRFTYPRFPHFSIGAACARMYSRIALRPAAYRERLE